MVYNFFMSTNNNVIETMIIEIVSDFTKSQKEAQEFLRKLTNTIKDGEGKISDSSIKSINSLQSSYAKSNAIIAKSLQSILESNTKTNNAILTNNTKTDNAIRFNNTKTSNSIVADAAKTNGKLSEIQARRVSEKQKTMMRVAQIEAATQSHIIKSSKSALNSMLVDSAKLASKRIDNAERTASKLQLIEARLQANLRAQAQRTANAQRSSGGGGGGGGLGLLGFGGSSNASYDRLMHVFGAIALSGKASAYAVASMVTQGQSLSSLMGIIAGYSVTLAANFEKSYYGISSFVGGGKEGLSMMRKLSELSLKTALGIQDARDQAQRLFALGFAKLEVPSVLKTVADAAAARGGGTEEINRITYALGQMKTKGKVMAEEMSQQLAELIPSWKYLAQKIGTDIPTAMKLVRKGAIDSSTGISALLEGMARDAAGFSEKTAGTLNRLTQDTRDTAILVLQDLGIRIANALDLTSALKSVKGFLSGMSEAINSSNQLKTPVWISDTLDSIKKLTSDGRAAFITMAALGAGAFFRLWGYAEKVFTGISKTAQASMMFVGNMSKVGAARMLFGFAVAGVAIYAVFKGISEHSKVAAGSIGTNLMIAFKVVTSALKIAANGWMLMFKGVAVAMDKFNLITEERKIKSKQIEMLKSELRNGDGTSMDYLIKHGLMKQTGFLSAGEVSYNGKGYVFTAKGNKQFEELAESSGAGSKLTKNLEELSGMADKATNSISEFEKAFKGELSSSEYKLSKNIDDFFKGLSGDLSGGAKGFLERFNSPIEAIEMPSNLVSSTPPIQEEETTSTETQNAFEKVLKTLTSQFNLKMISVGEYTQALEKLVAQQEALAKKVGPKDDRFNTYATNAESAKNLIPKIMEQTNNLFEDYIKSTRAKISELKTSGDLSGLVGLATKEGGLIDKIDFKNQRIKELQSQKNLTESSKKELSRLLSEVNSLNSIGNLIAGSVKNVIQSAMVNISELSDVTLEKMKALVDPNIAKNTFADPAVFKKLTEELSKRSFGGFSSSVTEMIGGRDIFSMNEQELSKLKGQIKDTFLGDKATPIGMEANQSLTALLGLFDGLIQRAKDLSSYEISLGIEDDSDEILSVDSALSKVNSKIKERAKLQKEYNLEKQRYDSAIAERAKYAEAGLLVPEVDESSLVEAAGNLEVANKNLKKSEMELASAITDTSISIEKARDMSELKALGGFLENLDQNALNSANGLKELKDRYEALMGGFISREAMAEADASLEKLWERLNNEKIELSGGYTPKYADEIAQAKESLDKLTSTRTAESDSSIGKKISDLNILIGKYSELEEASRRAWEQANDEKAEGIITRVQSADSIDQITDLVKEFSDINGLLKDGGVLAKKFFDAVKVAVSKIKEIDIGKKWTELKKANGEYVSSYTEIINELEDEQTKYRSLTEGNHQGEIDEIEEIIKGYKKLEETQRQLSKIADMKSQISAIMEFSDAIGEFGKSSRTVGEDIQRLGKGIGAIATAVGEPAIGAAIEFGAEVLGWAWDGISGMFDSGAKHIKNTLKEIMESAKIYGRDFENLGDTLGEKVINSFKGGKGNLGQLGTTIPSQEENKNPESAIDRIAKRVNGMVESYKQSYLFGVIQIDKVKFNEDVLSLVKEIVSSLSSGVMSGLSEGVEGFLKGTSDWREKIAEGFRKAIGDAIVKAIVDGILANGIIAKYMEDLTVAIANRDAVATNNLISRIDSEAIALAEYLESIYGGFGGSLAENNSISTQLPQSSATVTTDAQVYYAPSFLGDMTQAASDLKEGAGMFKTATDNFGEWVKGMNNKSGTIGVAEAWR